MSEYTYKRQTAKDIEISEADEKIARDCLNQIDADIRRTVKELKDAGYTDEEITQAFNYAATKIYLGL